MKDIETDIPACIRAIDIERIDADSLQASANCIFPTSFSGFAGHFPDNPILPAIVQLATVRHIAERGVGSKLLPKTFSRTKFRAMVKPDQEIVFQVRLQQTAGQWKGKFSIRTAEKEPVAEGNYIFTESNK